MMMIEMHSGDQTIRYDREATAEIYETMNNGWAEDCGCVGCRNLIAQRDLIYPVAFRELLKLIGVDSNKEAEAVADGPLDNGLHHYGGWFYFVGEMVTVGEGLVVVSDAPHFGYFFFRHGRMGPKEFRNVPYLGIEFVAHFKSVLDESWDSKLLVPVAPHAPDGPGT